MICLSVNVTPQMSVCLSASLTRSFSQRNFQQRPDPVGEPAPRGSDDDGPAVPGGASRDEGGRSGPGRHLAALKGGAWGEHPILAWRGGPGSCRARVNLGELG